MAVGTDLLLLVTTMLLALSQESLTVDETTVAYQWAVQAEMAKEATWAPPKYPVVTVQTGSTALIPCVVKNIGSAQVSWRKDNNILTVGLYQITRDDRFQVVHARRSDDWTLQVKHVQQRDAGLYECQVLSDALISMLKELRVVDAKADILGPTEKYVKSGDMLKITCALQYITEPPNFVYWYQNNRMINHDADVNVIFDEGLTSSTLVISSTRSKHSGNYSCVPSNEKAASTYVHVLDGEDRMEFEWKAGDWMKDYNEDINSKKGTCDQQFIDDYDKLQRSLSDMSAKVLLSEEKLTSSQRLHEQLIRDLEAKHQQQGEIWKLKLEIAELKTKAAEEETRKQCSQSYDSKAEFQGLFAATTQKIEKAEGMLEDCRTETKQLVRKVAEYRVNITVPAASHELAVVALKQEQNEQRIKVKDQTSTLESGLKNCSTENNMLKIKLEICGNETRNYILKLENCVKEVENITSAVTIISSNLFDCGLNVTSKITQLTECNQKLSSAEEKHRTEVETLKLQIAEEEKANKRKKSLEERQLLIRNLPHAKLHNIGGHEYFTQLHYHNWTGAVELCKSLDMNLISFETLEKWNVVRKYLADHETDLDWWFWSSAQRVGTNWKWNATGESVNFFTQVKPYSGKLNTEHCMIIRPTEGWREYKCEHSLYVMCE